MSVCVWGGGGGGEGGGREGGRGVGVERYAALKTTLLSYEESQRTETHTTLRISFVCFLCLQSQPTGVFFKFNSECVSEEDNLYELSK